MVMPTGTKHTPESRKRIADALRKAKLEGRTFNKEHRENMAKAKRNKPLSANHKRSIRLALHVFHATKRLTPGTVTHTTAKNLAVIQFRMSEGERFCDIFSEIIQKHARAPMPTLTGSQIKALQVEQVDADTGEVHAVHVNANQCAIAIGVTAPTVYRYISGKHPVNGWIYRRVSPQLVAGPDANHGSTPTRPQDQFPPVALHSCS